ncbi:MAG: nickel-type superoxide dismutase maturation protease [Candidatus Limnocylindria bacterium]
MPTLKARSWALPALLGVATVTGAALARRWLDVVQVVGSSMAPALLPGDLLLVERWSLRRRAPIPGEVVLAPDPRFPTRELVKRVAAVADGQVTLTGDHPAASTDSATFGPVAAGGVSWRVVARYWPPRVAWPRRRSATWAARARSRPAAMRAPSR